MRYQHATQRYATRYHGGGSDLGDIFAVNPIRRSATMIAVSVALIALPLLTLEGDSRMAVEIVTGWFGCTGLIMCTPILILSLLEEGWRVLQRRIWPTIEQLDLSPRAYNLLRRHGFVTIVSVERAADPSLLLLSNMDARTLHEIRRSISVWRYRRWQERGFEGAR